MQRARSLQSHHVPIRRGRLSATPLWLLLLSVLAGAGMTPASAQTAVAPTESAAAAPTPDIIKQREQELEAARTEQKNAVDPGTCWKIVGQN